MEKEIEESGVKSLKALTAIDCLSEYHKNLIAYYIYVQIEHGDDKHRAWLQKKIEEIFDVEILV